jgi:hypothetical protein
LASFGNFAMFRECVAGRWPQCNKLVALFLYYLHRIPSPNALDTKSARKNPRICSMIWLRLCNSGVMREEAGRCEGWKNITLLSHARRIGGAGGVVRVCRGGQTL